MKGLIIKEPWIDYILSGDKVWEIRGSSTTIRGEISLIKSGTGMVFGTVELIDCLKISLTQYQNSNDKHMISLEHLSEMPYKNTYAWVLANPKAFETPTPYRHPRGAVIWVNL